VKNTNHPTPLFLFSLPRSGSTLLMRILARHPNIETGEETHLLLPFLLPLQKRMIYGKLRQDIIRKGLLDFIHRLPGGMKDYKDQVRDLYLGLCARSTAGRPTYFLDKTPKYSVLAGEIIRMFPEAKIIFLWRNPLAMVASLVDTWSSGRWSVHHHAFALYEGLAAMVSAQRVHVSRSCSVRYEDLVSEPETTCRRIFEYLSLPFDRAVVKDFSRIRPTGILGDPDAQLSAYDTIRRDLLIKWKKTLGNSLRKAWCRRYLKWIGKDRLLQMGYDLAGLQAELAGLPSDSRFLHSDAVLMTYGTLFPFLEPILFRHKIKDLAAGKRLFVHR
jgi:hypothetical protein